MGKRLMLPVHGTEFGRWTLIRETSSDENGRRVICRCKCGTERSVNLISLMRRVTDGCGCNRGTLKHGMTGTREHKTWLRIKDRCCNPGHKNYSDRGINICERWLNSFENFLVDILAEVGPHPGPGYTIDRWPDNNGNYEPGNCRWATYEQQGNNTRVNVIIEIGGISHTIAEWSRISSTHSRLIQERLGRGWESNRAVWGKPDSLAGRFTSTKQITFKGETRSMKKWAEHLGFPVHIVKQRIRRGWSAERTLSTPVMEVFSHVRGTKGYDPGDGY